MHGRGDGGWQKTERYERPMLELVDAEEDLGHHREFPVRRDVPLRQGFVWKPFGWIVLAKI